MKIRSWRKVNKLNGFPCCWQHILFLQSSALPWKVMILLHLQHFSWPVPKATIPCVYLVFHKVKEAYLGKTESLLWTFTFVILNQVWQLQWKIFTALYTYWVGGGFWKKEGFQSHILLNSFLKYYLLHTRGKRRKCQDLDCTMIPENTAGSFQATNHRHMRHWSVWKNSSNKHCC